jgi:glycosyltransferase involved in cell wall biosynthesis
MNSQDILKVFNNYYEDSNGSKKWNKELLVLAIMIKNEEKRIEVSFDSVKNYCNTFVVLDTGSTDKTIEICKDYCKQNNITLHLKQEKFVNFSISRNVLLKYCDEVLSKNKFLLLLDCNDELKNGDELMNFIQQYKGNSTGFHLRQQWWTGTNLDSYFNIRMIKSHCKWTYKEVVHEYISCDDKELNKNPNNILKLDHIILFQDRTKDDDKSMRRFCRDKDLLFNEHLKDSTASRTLFYLAQTCGCLGNLTDAYKYYLLRIKEQGFLEEVYQSLFRLGEICENLGHPWEESESWFLKAFSHSQRAEPLIKIAEHYLEYNISGEKTPDYLRAYMYASMACKLCYPLNQILFVDRRCYNYKRWHVLGRCAFYAQRYKEGKEAVLKAIQMENLDLDINNLVCYLKKDKELNTNTLGGFICLTYIESDNKTIIPNDELKTTEYKITKEDALKKGLTLMLKK